jgi:hypothetical protein
MGFARDVSDRVMMFDNGQVVEDAPPDKLFAEREEQSQRPVQVEWGACPWLQVVAGKAARGPGSAYVADAATVVTCR